MNYDTWEDYEAGLALREWLEEQRLDREIERLERQKYYSTDWDGPPDINNVQWPYTLDDYLEAAGKGAME